MLLPWEPIYSDELNYYLQLIFTSAHVVLISPNLQSLVSSNGGIYIWAF